jgi:hypothetical protein
MQHNNTPDRFHPNPRYTTIQFLLAPINLSGHLIRGYDINQYNTPHDPFYNVMFPLINTIVMVTCVYSLFHVFHDKYFGFLVSGTYMLICMLIGAVIGPVDDMWVL